MAILRLLLLALVLNLKSYAAPRGTFGGSLKGIGSYERLRSQGIYSRESVYTLEERLRLQGNLVWDAFSLEVADQFFFFQQNAPNALVPIPDYSPTSAWNVTARWINTRSVFLFRTLDRAFIQYSQGDVEVRLGKQVIDEGTGRLFTAVSQVQRYPLNFIDQEYPKTEDAASVLWKGAFTLEAKFLPKVAGQNSHGYHVRAKGSKNGYDVAVTAGRSDDKPYVALEGAGNLGDSLVRGEVVAYEWQSRTAMQGLVGWDEVLSSEFTVQGEIFYNGFGGKPGSYVLGPLVHRSSPYRGLWYFGVGGTWEITPRWKSGATAIVNALDPSALVQAYVQGSLAENLDIELGQYLGVSGRGDTEFGGKIPVGAAGSPWAAGLSDLTYVEMKYYF